MSDTKLKSRKKSEIKQFENLRDTKLMKEGALKTLLCLEDMLSPIELLEKNGSRRYKLLKYLISSSKKNLNHIIDCGEVPEFAYKFEAGRLYVNGKQADIGVLKKWQWLKLKKTTLTKF